MSFAHRMKNALDTISSVALIGAAAALIWVLFFKDSARRPAQEPLVASVSGLHVDATHLTHVSGRGSIAIVEFSDFQCPFCAKHAEETLPILKRDLIGKGDVQYVALHYPIESIHPLAVEASEASECAGRQGQFWEMREQLFRNRTALEHADLISHAKAIGLNTSIFQQCLTLHETLDKIRADQAEAKRLGVIGTPVFFIGTVRPDGGIDLRKRIRGTAPAEVFLKQIAALRS